MVKISVYIPCLNSEKTIARCINSVKKQSLKPTEIIVIDDGSSDKTEQVAKKLKVKIIKHKKNNGIATARNTGLTNSKNELVASIDSDCVANKDWLKILNNSLEKDVVGVGGKLIESKKSVANKWRAKHMPQHWGEKKVKNPKYLAGSNTLFRKSNLKKINYYDTKFKTNYEDVDICKKIKKVRGKIIYEPKARVQHLAQDTIISVLDRHWRHMFWDYPKPNNLSNKMMKIIINFYTMLKFLLTDLFTKSELILIDTTLFFHHSLKDIKFK